LARLSCNIINSNLPILLALLARDINGEALISYTASASFIAEAGEQPEERDEGNEGEEQQQEQSDGQESIVSSWPSEPLATALTPS
jgi:hypothetical protein